jgi:hypothetical protein
MAELAARRWQAMALGMAAALLATMALALLPDGAGASGILRVSATAPANNAREVKPDAVISITFNLNATTLTNAFSIVCGGKIVTFSQSPQQFGSAKTYRLTPRSYLPSGATCQVTVFAERVKGTTSNPPRMTANYTFTFKTVAGPVINDETYDALGNVGLVVTAKGAGLLANDTGDNLQTPAGAFSTRAGGQIVVQSDGTFSYDPPPGFAGADFFTYTVTSTYTSRTATARFAVTSPIWFIDNSAAPGGDGRIGSPFNSIAAFNAVNRGGTGRPGNNAIIAILTGSRPYSDELVLFSRGQRVFGQGVDLASAAGLVVPPFSRPLPAAGGMPTIDRSSGGIPVRLAKDNEVRGLRLVGNEAGILANRPGSTVVGDSIFEVGGVAVQLTDPSGSVRIENNVMTGSAGVQVDLEAGSVANLVIAGNQITLQPGTISPRNGAPEPDGGAGVTLNAGAAAELGVVAISGNLIDGDGNVAIDVAIEGPVSELQVDGNTIGSQANGFEYGVGIDVGPDAAIGGLSASGNVAAMNRDITIDGVLLVVSGQVGTLTMEANQVSDLADTAIEIVVESGGELGDTAIRDNVIDDACFAAVLVEVYGAAGSFSIERNVIDGDEVVSSSFGILVVNWGTLFGVADIRNNRIGLATLVESSGIELQQFSDESRLTAQVSGNQIESLLVGIFAATVGQPGICLAIPGGAAGNAVGESLLAQVYLLSGGDDTFEVVDASPEAVEQANGLVPSGLAIDGDVNFNTGCL